MPYYAWLDAKKDKRAIQGLLDLKKGLAEEGIPPRTVQDTLLLATWNLREFGKSKHGYRTRESLAYIAEVISRFDLVAIQEIREDLSMLRQLKDLLGGWWKPLYTDVTEGPQGNYERLAFLYDARKLQFGGLAGEIVIPPVPKGNKTYEPSRQLARTPYLVGFQAGWFKFTICTVHILYGEDKPDNPERVHEIWMIGDFLAARIKEKNAWARNMILLGDFNIYNVEDPTMAAITGAGFEVPEPLQKLPSNAPKTHHYDQIAFIAPDVQDQLACSRSGVFNVLDHVYRPADQVAFIPDMGDAYAKTKTGAARSKKDQGRYYMDWRTYQMSDHLPMWIELKIDFSGEYLRRKQRGGP